MGLASAMAWLLFLIVAVLTAVSFISQKHWVYYGDEER
jgi:oligogalacturonide transport system permease protein